MESLKQPSARLKVAALLSSIALTGCSMEAGVTPRLSADEGEPLFPIPAECSIVVEQPSLPPIDNEHESPTPKSEADIRAQYKDANSPIENRTNPFDKVDNALETMGFFGEFEKIQEFQLRDSGIVVEIRSNAPGVYVDEEAFSDIVLMPLDKADLFQQPNLQQQMRCYRQAVLENKEFEGNKLEVYIPNDHTLCFTEDFALEPIAVCKERKAENIDNRYYRGFTPPQIELETSFFTFKQDDEKQLMFLVDAQNDPEKAGERTDATLLHEAGHYWWWLNGGPLKMTQGLEQPINAMEAEVKTILKQKSQPLPRAIHYR